MQAPLGVRAGVSQVGETRQAGRLRHVETKGETHRETESDQGRSLHGVIISLKINYGKETETLRD